jgi:hypothetical protein
LGRQVRPSNASTDIDFSSRTWVDFRMTSILNLIKKQNFRSNISFKTDAMIPFSHNVKLNRNPLRNHTAPRPHRQYNHISLHHTSLLSSDDHSNLVLVKTDTSHSRIEQESSSSRLSDVCQSSAEFLGMHLSSGGSIAQALPGSRGESEAKGVYSSKVDRGGSQVTGELLVETEGSPGELLKWSAVIPIESQEASRLA